jgi:hypothetical protein
VSDDESRGLDEKSGLGYGPAINDDTESWLLFRVSNNCHRMNGQASARYHSQTFHLPLPYLIHLQRI